jgi:hypothetical protein
MKCNKNTVMTDDIKRLVEHFANLLRYAETNTCLHEETHRGGSIWEICDRCGKTWADDEGGKPSNAHSWPKEILMAQETLEHFHRNYKVSYYAARAGEAHGRVTNDK